MRDLRVDPGGRDADLGGLVAQVTDLAQEGLVRVRFDRTRVGLMPRVEGALESLALREQGTVAGGELGDQPLEPGPEPCRRDLGARKDLVLDEAPQDLRDLQRSDVLVALPVDHAVPPVRSGRVGSDGCVPTSGRLSTVPPFPRG